MTKSNGRSNSRLARLLGVALLLGLPLATPSALDTARDVSSARSDVAAPGRQATPAGGAALDADEAANPAAPLPPFDSIEIRESDSSTGADPVTSVVNDPRCGTGFTSIASSAAAPYACVHTAADPLGPPGAPFAQATASAAPVCLGNGVNGPRIQLLYVYVEGQPDRTAQMVPRIVNEFVPRMEATYRETSKLQGREIGMRLNMPDCKLAVDTLMIDEDNGTPDNPGAMLNRMTEFISQQGYSTTDRKYIVWFDGGNKGACGVAPAMTTLAANVSDNAVTGNISNIGWQAILPETALIFRYGQPILGEPAYSIPECWGRGGTGARTELHELIHLLGAVNLSAPNSNGLGHCTDDLDIMCYGEQGVSTVQRCATRIEQLDCGADDYFNARPSAGSYLSTNWNTANSRFLGDAIVDNVPLEIPRP